MRSVKEQCRGIGSFFETKGKPSEDAFQCEVVEAGFDSVVWLCSKTRRKKRQTSCFSPSFIRGRSRRVKSDGVSLFVDCCYTALENFNPISEMMKLEVVTRVFSGSSYTNVNNHVIDASSIVTQLEISVS